VKPFYLSSETVLPIKPFYLSNATCTATSSRLAANRTADQVPQSLYSTQNKTLQPGKFAVPKKTGGGYWIGEVGLYSGDLGSIPPGVISWNSVVTHSLKAPGFNP
jgi:hypothetical protein